MRQPQADRQPIRRLGVANLENLFNVVGLKKYNYIGNADLHSLRHLYLWRTLLRCEKNTEAITAHNMSCGERR